MTLPAQLQLIHAPIAGLEPIPIRDANALLVEWGHKLGPCERPFGQEAFALLIEGRYTCVAISASLVSPYIADVNKRILYRRKQVVELARLCAPPGVRWVNRVMLRFWRELLAPRWKYWPVRAAVSYSHNAQHKGELYRADGWEKIRDNCGSGGGGTYSTKRDAESAVNGAKTLWLWRYRDDGFVTVAT